MLNYKLSFKVKASELTEALSHIHTITENVLVTPLSSIALNGAGRVVEAKPVMSVSDAPEAVRPKKRRAGGAKYRPKTYRQRTGKFKTEIAIDVLNEYGATPFKLDDFNKKLQRKGLGSAVGLRALSLEAKAGHVKKLSPGIYQRSPKAFISKEAIALAERTLDGVREAGSK